MDVMTSMPLRFIRFVGVFVFAEKITATKTKNIVIGGSMVGAEDWKAMKHGYEDTSQCPNYLVGFGAAAAGSNHSASMGDSAPI